MKIVLCAGTPAEHAADRGHTWDGRQDFAFGSYNYAVALLRACALADDDAARSVDAIAIEDFPVERAQPRLWDAQIARVVAGRPDVVGLSCYCWDAGLLLASAAVVRRALPGARIVAGGPSVSWCAEAVLRRHADVDLVVRGEGERAFVELARRGFADAVGVADVTHRAPGGEIVANPPSREPVDLAGLPSPYLGGSFAPRAPGVLFEPSRGCRLRCSFCSWSRLRGAVRYAPRERMAAEIGWAAGRGYAAANFCDTAANHETARLRTFCEALDGGDPKRTLRCSVFMRHEQLDDQQLAILRARPLEEIILGIESINPRALRACGKRPIDLAALERKLARLGEAGHRMTLSLMSGLPGDSIEGFAATLDYVEGLQRRMPEAINFICCFWLAVLPGTRFEALASRFGFETAAWGTPYVVASRDFPPRRLHEAARLVVERCDRNPRLHCEEVHREAAGGAGHLRAVAAADAARPRAGKGAA